MEIGQRVKQLREAKGWSQAELAKRVRDAGGDNVKQPHINQLETGDTRQPRYLRALARVFEVDPDWLETGIEPKPDRIAAPALAEEAPPYQPRSNVGEIGEALDPRTWPRDVPVYGTAVGGAEEHGAFDFNVGDIIDHVRRPPRLHGVKNVFAVFAVGESMLPRIRPGGPVIIHPGIQPAMGDEVLIELKPTTDGGAHPGLIKRLVSRTETRLRLQQFNPPDDNIIVPMKRVLRIYRIVPYEDLLAF